MVQIAHCVLIFFCIPDDLPGLPSTGALLQYAKRRERTKRKRRRGIEDGIEKKNGEWRMGKDGKGSGTAAACPFNETSLVRTHFRI